MESFQENSSILDSLSNFDVKDYVNIVEAEADLSLAKKHGKAQLVYNINSNKYKTSNVDFCDCCFLPLPCTGIVEQYPLCVSIKELSSVGVGIYLYFYYIKYMLFILLTLLLTAAAPIGYIHYLYSGEVLKFCSAHGKMEKVQSICSKVLKFKVSSIVFRTSAQSIYYYNTISSIVNPMSFNSVGTTTSIVLFTGLALFVINAFFYVIFKILAKKANINTITPADYTLKISGINHKFSTIEETKHETLKTLNINEIFPVDLNPTYKIGGYFRLKQSYLEIANKISNCQKLNVESYTEGLICTKQISVQRLKEKFLQEEIQLKACLEKLHTNFKGGEFTKIIFVQFNDAIERQTYLSYFPQSLSESALAIGKFIASHYLCKCCFSDRQRKLSEKVLTLKVEPAPEPVDILWENLQHGAVSRILRRFLLYFVMSFLILISFFIILTLNYFNKAQKASGQFSRFLTYGISFSISNIITLVNSFISYFIKLMAEKEKNHTLTEYYLSCSIKITLFSFFNTGLIPLIVNYLNHNWESKELLISDVFCIFLSNGLVRPLLWFFKTKYLYAIFQRFMLEWKAGANNSLAMTQKKANQLYENTNVNLPYKYSYFATTVLKTVLFLPIFPLGVVFAMTGMSLTYLIEKYNILRHYKRPEMLSEHIAMYFVDSFNITLLVFALSNLIFSKSSYSDSLGSIMLIVFFIFLVFFPINRCTVCSCCRIKETAYWKKSYNKALCEFNFDYDRCNPLTKTTGRKKYIENLKMNNLITEEKYSKMVKEIESKIQTANELEEYYKQSVHFDTKLRLNDLSKSIQNVSKNEKLYNDILEYCKKCSEKTCRCDDNSFFISSTESKKDK